ncbi:major facilitator superfamily domain-containing protein [Xylariales sp. PMI_506]|nr:major facilitator superfamily domain-containing protein [Xylariales sp. PMI_506]
MSQSPVSRDGDESAQKAALTNTQYPSNAKRITVMAAMYLAIFLITLDQNIISTAIPRITDEFHSIGDIGWYGSAYMLTTCSFQLLLGKIYKYYPAKPVFLICCTLFEVGSAICGAAPSSNAFIVGRAIAGVGCSGLFSGVMVVLFHTVPLQQRPIYQGAFGAVFTVASVIGPVVGGTLTDRVTWRWCFYINLPIGAVSILVTLLILHLPNQELEPRAEGWIGKIRQLDPLGNLAFFPGIVCLILALQWGGTTYAWNDARIIVLIVLFVVLVLVFLGIQIWKGESATVPPRIVKIRSITASIWYGFFSGAAMMVVVYYLPIWFQAIKDVDAITSGVMLLPLFIATVVGSLSSGIIISRVGYYTPFFILSSIIMPIGAGLLSTFTPTTGHPRWIGYQVVLGFGLGLGSQQPLNVAQTVLERADISTGTSLIMFTRFLGSSIFLPVAESVFLNSLVSKLSNLPGINASDVSSGGATELRSLASGDNLNTLLSDYNAALVNVFYVVVATSSVTILGSVLVEWRSLKARAQEQEAARAQQADKATIGEPVKAEETKESI